VSPASRNVVSPRLGWEPVEPAPVPGAQVSAIVDIRTLQSLRIVVPPAIPTVPPVHTATTFETDLALPTFDELLYGPIGRPAASASAGLPLLVRLTGRARVIARRRAAPSAGGRG
jgi:hypothetical protein